MTEDLIAPRTCPHVIGTWLLLESPKRARQKSRVQLRGSGSLEARPRRAEGMQAEFLGRVRRVDAISVG
jgi:hypothetical protein